MDIRVETIDIPVTGGEIVHGTADFPRDGANLDRGAIAVIRVPQPGLRFAQEGAIDYETA